jgi:hypothetical protein
MGWFGSGIRILNIALANRITILVAGANYDVFPQAGAVARTRAQTSQLSSIPPAAPRASK